MIIGALFAYLKWDAIFQRGNPIPYLKAMAQISDDNTYIEVEGKDNVYISRNGECPEMFHYYEETYDLEYVEQAGSGYLFTNGTDNFVISSEVYYSFHFTDQIEYHDIEKAR